MLNLLSLAARERCRLTLDQPILAAVSGGPDSLCVLDGLHRLGFRLAAAHFDHGLRAEAADEARRVEAFAGERGLPFLLGRGDVRACAQAQRLSLEEAARNQRYGFLFAQAQSIGAQAVVTGHNADDQVETVLMHLLRGAGLAGLRGMSFYALPNPWSVSIPLARPLLGVWREEILAYLAQNGLVPNLDASNEDLTFYRNRLRHELIPTLESYNPQARRLIWRTAEILFHEDAALSAVEEAAWQAAAAPAGEHALAL
ncbi:MAG: tRNA lysidine(34) synthetase TilS, partial [Chloroflexi bacterium]|nr:tRNA lysidine(34) synthetase TilS [Chloroflexota bacterium]